MKVCSNCNQKCDDEMIFCPKCGKELVNDYNQTCPKCKRLVERGFEFCPYCGYQFRTNIGPVNGAFEAEDQTTISDDIDTEFEKGIMYYRGKGVRQDYVEAAKHFQKIAEQGHVVAQYNLGWMYWKGQGVGKDYIEAAKWFIKAAEQGNAKGVIS